MRGIFVVDFVAFVGYVPSTLPSQAPCLLEAARAKTKNIEITAFFVFDIRNGVGYEKMPQLRTLVRAWGIFSCLLEIARAKTKNIEITVFFVFDIRKP